MSDPLEFKRRQDAEVEALRKTFHKKSKEYVTCAKVPASKEAQIAALLDMVASGRDYYRKCEDATLDRDGLSGGEFYVWLNDRVAAADSVLNGLPNYYRHLRRERDRLGLAPSTFEPTPAVYQHMQALLAAARPEKAWALKIIFQNVNLPVAGFENPFKPEPASLANVQSNTPQSNMKPPTPMPLFLTIVIMFGLLALACIIGGIYAIYKGSAGDTAFDVLGFHLKTTHVGVAFMAIGVVTAAVTTRAVLKKV